MAGIIWGKSLHGVEKHLEEREARALALALLLSSGKTLVPLHHLPSEQISNVVASLFICSACKIRIHMTKCTYNYVFKICVQLGLSLKVNLPGDITSSAYIKCSVKMQPGFWIKFHALRPGLQLAHIASVLLPQGYCGLLSCFAISASIFCSLETTL